MLTKSSIAFRRCVTVASALFLTAGIAQAVGDPEFAKLVANDAASTDFFGYSVAVSGTTAISGAVGKNGTTGAAYLFDTTTGLQTMKLVANDGFPNDSLGTSVAISGTTAIVGAMFDLDNGANSGSAYLFDTTTGLQLAKLLASDGAAQDTFGHSAAINGTVAIVGAPRNEDVGAAYLYDTTTGLQLAKLQASDGALNDNFGGAVAINGTTAVVGAFADDDNGSASGSVYLFDTTTGLQVAKLLASDGTASDAFGFSVAISGTTLIVGARGNQFGGDTGAAYLFDTTTGLEIAKLLASDGSAGDEFGNSVAISGTIAIVGAPEEDDNGGGSGAAYLFDTTTGLQIAKLQASDGESSDSLGESVGIGGTTAIAGALFDEDNGFGTGSAYLFDATQPPALAGDVASISLATGGSQILSLEGGCARAGWFYFMFGSVTGTTPGIDFGGGVVLPLNDDRYFRVTLNNPGAAIFNNFNGFLDGAGQAVATLSLPTGLQPALIGVTLNHAYLAGEVVGHVGFASNAVSVLLVP
ncbi:MAG: hypothetical protein ACI8TQ_002921 [Planctomycetota bacterium]|jgi:hypothetical protein